MNKRTRKLKKAYKKCLKDLDNLLGEQDAGLLIAILLNLLKAIEEERQEDLNLRTLEITLNDFFSAKWNFEKGGLEK